MKQLHGRVAIVTGCSRDIGVPIAEALAKRGVRLSISARSADDLDASGPTSSASTCE